MTILLLNVFDLHSAAQINTLKKLLITEAMIRFVSLLYTEASVKKIEIISPLNNKSYISHR